jgi:hypothetical protein
MEDKKKKKKKGEEDYDDDDYHHVYNFGENLMVVVNHKVIIRDGESHLK